MKAFFEDTIDNIIFYFDKYIVDPFRNIKWFFVNLKLFWCDLWKFRPWDHEYCKYIYCTALDALKEDIYRNSFEIEETRMRKVEAMEELLMLLQTDLNDNFDILIEERKDGTFDFKKYNAARIRGEKLLKERILRILGGQSYKELNKLDKQYNKDINNMKEKHPVLYNTFKEQFNESETIDDGTGVDCWWD